MNDASADLFDWRPPLARLTRRWRIPVWVTGLAIATALAWLGVSPFRYEATAYLAVARPDDMVNLGEPEQNLTVNTGSTQARVTAARAYAELVGTPAMAERTLAALTASGPVTGLGSTDALLNHVRTRALADGALIVIEARATTPQDAARVANTWASAFSAQLEDVLGGTGDASRLAAERDVAKLALDRTEAALARIRAASSSGSNTVAPNVPVVPGQSTAQAGGQEAAQGAEEGRLDRDRILAEERYMALARRAEELRIGAAAARPEVRLVSPAIPPGGIDLGRPARILFVAGLLGLCLGALAALVWPSRR